MLLAAAQATLKKDRRMLARIKWAKKRAEDLAVHRNDPAHTAMFPVETSGRPELWLDMIASKKASLDRLMQTPTDRRWQRTCGDLIALYRYCAQIFLALVAPRRASDIARKTSIASRSADHGRPAKVSSVPSEMNCCAARSHLGNRPSPFCRSAHPVLDWRPPQSWDRQRDMNVRITSSRKRPLRPGLRRPIMQPRGNAMAEHDGRAERRAKKPRSTASAPSIYSAWLESSISSYEALAKELVGHRARRGGSSKELSKPPCGRCCRGNSA